MSTKLVIGSRNSEMLNELALGIKVGNHERLTWNYDSRPIGRCFVTGIKILGMANDCMIRVQSKDKRGNHVVERYRIGHTGFAVLYDGTIPSNGWDGF